MSSKYPHGMFSWIDLSTTDAAGAKAFYSELFGWTSIDMPIDVGGVYTMFQLNGKDVAGMSEMGAEQKAQGMPPNWTSYVTVDNVDEMASKVSELGGTLMMPPFDVMTAGRMALAQDPTGAVFAIWQAGDQPGASVFNEPGSLAWNELVTTDTAKAEGFYTNLFGWEAKPQQMPDMVYTTFMNGERMNAGMMAMRAEWGEMPSHWMIYLSVDDCDAIAKKAESLGGKIHVPPTDIPNIGRFSLIADPQGGMFTVMKMNQYDESPV